MPLIAFWDTETDGLLNTATKMHSLGIIFSDGRTVSAADQPGHTSIKDALKLLAQADIRVAHNGNDFDERITRRLYPGWSPKGIALDTLLISRLLYPQIYSQGPNSHKVPTKLRMGHSLKAWGYRLGDNKGDFAEIRAAEIQAEHPDWTPEQVTAEVWRTWTPAMQDYMMQDVAVLKKLFQYLMSRQPPQEAVEIEHAFATIIRRQEAWGFTFDYDKALELQAELGTKARTLEASLIEDFGDFWMAGKETVPKATRQVKLPEFPDVVERRFGVKGKELKPYIGPPKCTYEVGCAYTPVEYLQFQPSSPIHVEKLLRQRYGWKPSKFTDKGRVQLDDEVLRGLPYPEAQKLADLYGLSKVWGYVSQGRKAWMKTAIEERPGEWRQHGRVNTVGTYTFRCSHSDPNMGQVPSRDPHYGHLCRSLFIARRGFTLVGFDGSGMQLRLMAHYMAEFDGGAYADNFLDPEFDPHVYMRDTIGTDILGEGTQGRAKGKTINYALPFGGGELRLGSIVDNARSEAHKKALGRSIKERLAPTFGVGFEGLKTYLKEKIEKDGFIVGLDGRRAYTSKAHTGLSTLLQTGEAVIMRKALIMFDREMQRRGFKPGVDAAGICHPDTADYEFTANVHDEAQADVRYVDGVECQPVLETYRRVSLWCVGAAGRHFKLRCPLKSDVKDGPNWSFTH